MKLTITEALAELKTIGKRIDKKRVAIAPYLARQEMVKDPLEKEEGGSEGYVARERQAIGDMCRRIVAIRIGIQTVNLTIPVTVNKVTKTVAEWLVWRRDVAKIEKQVLDDLRNMITHVRGETNKRNAGMRMPGEAAFKPEDIRVSVSETEINSKIEGLETTLGELDGKLSLINATNFIEIPD